MFAIVSAREELSCSTSQVVVGSKEQCFAGDLAVCRHSITASGVLSIDCLIFFDLSVEEIRKVIGTEIARLMLGASCKSKLTFDHSNLELVKFVVIVVVW